MNSVLIRPARDSDLPLMFRISVATHQASYGSLIPPSRRDDFDEKYTVNAVNEAVYIKKMAKRIVDPHWHIWTAEDRGKVVGYTLAVAADNSQLFKRGLFVLPECQGKGIGKSLFLESIKDTQYSQVTLSVLTDNLRAKRMYENFGFKAVGRDEKSFFGAELTKMSLIRN